MQKALEQALTERIKLEPSVGLRLFNAASGAIALLEGWTRKDPAELQVLRELHEAKDLALKGIDHEH